MRQNKPTINQFIQFLKGRFTLNFSLINEMRLSEPSEVDTGQKTRVLLIHVAIDHNYNVRLLQFQLQCKNRQR